MQEVFKDQLIQLYRKRADFYDFTANLYYLIGYREFAFRKQAVEQLRLNHGDLVVDLACGTGINFSYLQEKVGSEGKIIGVDMTDAMLAQARKRIKQQGWQNVELIQSDMADFSFPSDARGVLCTFALALCPEYDRVVQKIYEVLPIGGRLVELSVRIPERKLKFFKLLLFPLIRPFGDPSVYIHHRPWESIAKYFDSTEYRSLYFGFSYIVRGEKT